MSLDGLTLERQGELNSEARHRVIDADAHLDPPYEMWANYLPKHLAEQAPSIEHGDEHDWIVFEGKRRPLAMISNQAGRKGKDYKMFGRRSEMRQAWLPEVRLGDMDTDGIDAAVMFGGGPLGTANIELYTASFEAYNHWLWDFCAADRRRLVPVAYLPMRDLDETIGMIERLAKMGFKSVNIPAFPQPKDGPQIGGFAAQAAALTGSESAGSYRDLEYDRLWALLSDHDITATMHLGGRVPRFGDKTHLLPDMVMSKLAMAEPIAIMIYNAIFQRFPKLRLVTVESGVGWMAWMAEYMDRTWEKQRYWTDSALEERPSFYMDRNIYGSFINDRLGILNRDQPGGKNIMWSSDYPHSETSFPNSRDVIARDFEGVPEQDIRMITCDHARKVYSIG